MASLVEPSNVKVRSLDLDFHEISWEVSDQTTDIWDYTFQILRSESAEGPFEPISVPFEDRYVFVDNFLQVANRWRVLFYRIRVTDKRSGEWKDFGPYSSMPEPDLITMEVRRHINLLMQEFVGRRMWLLPVRTFGQRCDCWSPTLSKRIRSGCMRCYDTGFVRGYLAPIEVWAQIDPSPKTDQITNVGAMQQSNTTARIGYYPPLKPRDVLVEAENRRWRVVQVSQTEKGRAILHQELQLHEIPPRDIEYAIPIDLPAPLRELAITPARNYSNPHNLESYERDVVANLMDFYNRRPT